MPHTRNYYNLASMEVDKGKLRKLLGAEGDVNDRLAEEYGSAYLDHPDDTQEDVPPVLRERGFAMINGILSRQHEAAPVIDCETSQRIVSITLKDTLAMRLCQ